jgi:hypothetical protein
VIKRRQLRGTIAAHQPPEPPKPRDLPDPAAEPDDALLMPNEDYDQLYSGPPGQARPAQPAVIAPRTRAVIRDISFEMGPPEFHSYRTGHGIEHRVQTGTARDITITIRASGDSMIAILEAAIIDARERYGLT